MQDLFKTIAAQYELDPEEFVKAVKDTCFPGGAATDAQLFMFLSVARKYQLDPFAKELYAFVTGGKLQVIVGLDGWLKVANRDPAFDGIDFLYDEGKDGLDAVTCRVHRKDRGHPIEATEFMVECKQPTKPWEKWPRRMLTNKAMVQGFRRAFALTEILDQDEAERIAEVDGRAQPVVTVVGTPAIEYHPAQPTGHLRVKVDLPAGPQEDGREDSISSSAANSEQQDRGRAPVQETRQSEAIKSSPPEMVVGNAHGEQGLPPIGAHGAQGEPATADLPPAADETRPDSPPTRRGRPAGSKNKPKLEPDPIAVMEAQQAAGLEVLDPTESALETFIRANDLEQRRVDATLAKFGADKVSDLSAEDSAKVLRIFQNSIAAMEAAKGA